MENGYDDFGNLQKKKLKPVHGILLFVLVMASYYTIIAWMQMKFGMYGLAMTELYLLLLSVGITVLCGADLAEVFPVRKPAWSKVFGTLLLWAGVYALVLPATMVIAWLFPRQMFGTGSALNDMIASVPLLLSVFITAVMPAVCEEAMHRGVILHSLKSLKREWLIVLVMGILFGLFHGSVWRFVPTALLGGALSWLMLKTENMVYPALFHFANNFLPTLLTFGQTENDATAGAGIPHGSRYPHGSTGNLCGDRLRGTICHLYGGLSDTKGKRKKSALFSERTSDILDRISHHLFRDTGNDRRRVIFVWDFL